MTVKRFEEEVYNALRQDQTLASITGGIIAPQAYSDQSYKFMTEQRRVKLLTLGRNAVEKPENPNNEELKAYIAEHQGQYTAPEYRRFTLLRVEVSDLLPDMEASEEKIADLFDYKLKAELLGSPETRSIARIVSTDKATADRATLALNTGKNADAVASEFGLDEPTVYTDILPGATMDPKTGEAAFKMGQGKAETLESSLGTWYSVIVTGITPATIPDMENEREALVTEIKTEKAERFIYDVQDVIQEALDTGATLEEAALGSEVAVASYDFVSSIGENQKGDRMAGLEGWPGISEDDRILTEVFTSEPGFEGNIFETANKGIAAIRVDEIKESARRSFEEVKAQALEAWHLEQANKALAALMDEVADKAAAGESLEVLAAGFEKGAKLRESLMLRAAPLTICHGISRYVCLKQGQVRPSAGWVQTGWIVWSDRLSKLSQTKIFSRVQSPIHSRNKWQNRSIMTFSRLTGCRCLTIIRRVVLMRISKKRSASMTVNDHPVPAVACAICASLCPWQAATCLDPADQRY